MAKRPNLVFIFSDQHRIQSLGCWSALHAGALRGGGDPVHTPSLDRLAAQSLTLTRATSSAPVCSPYRAMLFTGCYPERNGVPNNCSDDRPSCRLDVTRPLFASLLADAGYDCGYIGKYHLDYPHCFDQDRPDWYPGGWDVYTPPERRPGYRFWHSYGTFDVHKNPHYWDRDGRRTDPKRWSPSYEADVACSFIRNDDGERQADQPFALFVSMNPPHTPSNSLEDCEAEDFVHYADRDIDDLLVRPNVIRGEGEGDEARYYFAQVTGVDRAVGQILAALDETGLADDTVVVFTSDHGCMLFSHGYGGKSRIYSEAFQVPFLLRAPGLVEPRTDDLLLTPVDIMPTLLGVLGLGERIPADIDGRDYSACWTSAWNREAPDRPESVPFFINKPGPSDEDGLHHGYVPASRGLHTQRYSLVFRGLDGQAQEPVLYDDEADPYQLQPLVITDHEELFVDLCADLTAYCERMDDPWRPPSAMK